MIARKRQSNKYKEQSLMVQEGGRMSARMVSSSLNAMHEIRKTKSRQQNQDRTEATVRPTGVSVVYKKGIGNATMAKACVVGIRVS